MSQQDAAKEQANTRKNVRVVSIFTAAAIGIVGVLVILYAGSCPRSRVIPSLLITPTCAARPRSSVRKSTATLLRSMFRILCRLKRRPAVAD